MKALKLSNLLHFPGMDDQKLSVEQAFCHNGGKDKDYKAGMAIVQRLIQPQLFPEYFAISVCKAVIIIV